MQAAFWARKWRFSTDSFDKNAVNLFAGVLTRPESQWYDENMYLRGSKWSMQKRRKPLNLFRIFVLLSLIGAAVYFERMVVPDIPVPGAPTPEPTRNPESYIAEADAYYRAGQLAQAADSYQAALLANPSDTATYITLARTQLFLGNYVDAQTSAENALLLNQNNATAHAVRGKALTSQGDFLGAESAINRALEIDSNHALAHAFYAELLAEQYISGGGPFNVIERMTEVSRAAVSLGQGTVEAHRARGYVLEVTGNYEDAIREYETAIAINPNIAGLHLALGRTYRQAGIFDKAFEALNIANALNPSDPTPDLIISRIYFTTGEFTRAEQYAEQAIRDAPTETLYYGNLGQIQYRNFKWAEALENLSFVVNGGLYQDEIQVEPLTLQPGRIAEYYYYYAFALLRLERCNEAVPVFQQIVAGVPSDQTAVFNATEGLRLCAESLASTPSNPTSVPDEDSTP
jgi:tetratricopeptide (TPR) repeat protein